MRGDWCSVWDCHGKATAYCSKHEMWLCERHAPQHQIHTPKPAYARFSRRQEDDK